MCLCFSIFSKNLWAIRSCSDATRSVSGMLGCPGFDGDSGSCLTWSASAESAMNCKDGGDDIGCQSLLVLGRVQVGAHMQGHHVHVSKSAKAKAIDMPGPSVLNETAVGPPVPTWLGVCVMPVVQNQDFAGPKAGKIRVRDHRRRTNPEPIRYRWSNRGFVQYWWTSHVGDFRIRRF